MYNHSFQNGTFYCVQLTNYLYDQCCFDFSNTIIRLSTRTLMETKNTKKRNHEVCCREVGRCPFDIVLKTKGP